MFAARPSPVTQPMRADSIWMPIISGIVRNSVQTRREAELRAGLRVGGDAARVVVGGAGDEAGAEPAREVFPGGRAHCGAVARALSSTSIQCRTGVVVPLCRCGMQPMLAETIAWARAPPGGRACGRAAAWPARAAAANRCRPSRSTGALRSAARARRSRARADASRRRRAAAGRAAGAGRMERDRRGRLRDDSFGRSVGTMSGSSSDEVARQVGDAARLLGIGRIVAQQVAVFLDRHAAAGGVHHDRLDRAGRDLRPPGVDVAPHVASAAVVVVEM